MLRSFRLGEADRVLHLYTLDRGRVGAVAKGIRKTKSRFGARLEPLSHVELMLHQGSGELQTVTGVDLAPLAPRGARGAVPARGRPDRRRGDAAPLHRAGGERARVPGADALPRPARRPRAALRAPALDPLALSFQLKLLWLSGYLPHLTSCVECGAESEPLVGYSPQAGGASAATARRRLARALARRASRESRRCSRAARRRARRGPRRSARRATRSRVITPSYEYHGGFRLRTLRSA